jgi:hypothetical protein
MIRGTTPIIYMAFGVEIESLKEFKIIFEQEGKENLIKANKDCTIDTENNVAYTKLSQEETLAFDERKVVKVQAKCVTLDGNVIASDIVKEGVCPTLDETPFEDVSSEITPINTNTIKFDFSNSNCGFALDFGDMIVYQEIPADKQLSSTSTNALENKVITENFARVDNQFVSVEQRANEIEAIAKGASKGKVYYDYYNMWGDISAMPKDYLSVPDHIFLQVVNVPDLWVMHTTDENHIYDFTSNEQFLNDLLEQGMVWVGHFVLSMLETQKVDLTDYAKKSQVPVISAIKKENGAYSLTITMGVE